MTVMKLIEIKIMKIKTTKLDKHTHVNMQNFLHIVFPLSTATSH